MIVPEWTILFYPLLMLSALATGIWLKGRQKPDPRLTPYERLWIGLGAFIGAMLMAKLPFVLLDPGGMSDGSAFLMSGKTILFGLVGGYFGVELVKWRMAITVKTGDSFAVPVAGSIAVGRLSCFAGGCCYGTPTQLPWGFIFPAVDHLPRHPTQLYESAFHLTAAIVMASLQRRGLLSESVDQALFHLLLRVSIPERIRPPGSPRRFWTYSVSVDGNGPGAAVRVVVVAGFCVSMPAKTIALSPHSINTRRRDRCPVFRHEVSPDTRRYSVSEPAVFDYSDQLSNTTQRPAADKDFFERQITFPSTLRKNFNDQSRHLLHVSLRCRAADDCQIRTQHSIPGDDPVNFRQHRRMHASVSIALLKAVAIRTCALAWGPNGPGAIATATPSQSSQSPSHC